jgi:hypothetical protein
MSLVRIAAGIAAAALALASLPAVAVDINQQKASTAWKQTDLCARAAFKKFPDYTPESNAKREVARRTCLRDHKLPSPEGVPSVAAAPEDHQ